MGMESYGVCDALIVPTIVEQLKDLKKRIRILPNSVIKRIKPRMIADVISAYSGSDVVAEHIIALGDKCWRLIYEINLALGFNMLEDSSQALPEHFYIDPDSNHNEQSIVPYRSLVERYIYLRKQTVAVQSSNLK